MTKWIKVGGAKAWPRLTRPLPPILIPNGAVLIILALQPNILLQNHLVIRTRLGGVIATAIGSPNVTNRLGSFEIRIITVIWI